MDFAETALPIFARVRLRGPGWMRGILLCLLGHCTVATGVSSLRSRRDDGVDCSGERIPWDVVQRFSDIGRTARTVHDYILYPYLQ